MIALEARSWRLVKVGMTSAGGEPLELLEHQRFRRAHRVAHRHALEPGVFLLASWVSASPML
jgi:hypothetical protein